MEDLPLVTVCHLCYNNANWIIESADAVRKSTYPHIEHIIIDDCSTDDSWIRLKEYVAALDSGAIKLIRHEQNAGIPAGHNHGVKIANGKYYCGAVSDDIIAPEKIMEDVLLMESVADEEVVGVYSLAQFFTHVPGDREEIMGFPRRRTFMGFKLNRNFHIEEGKVPTEQMKEILSRKNFIPAPTTMLRTDWLKGSPYDSSFFLEDYPKWVDLCLQGKALWFRKDLTTYYRRSEKSFSSKFRNDSIRLRVIHDTVRCRMTLLEDLGHWRQSRSELRERGHFLLRANFGMFEEWFHSAVAERQWRGPLYFTSRYTSNKYFLKMALMLSRLTPVV